MFLYQATWQLAGFTNPRFITFMERYNPRPDNAAKQITRGRIFDAVGRELAVSDPDSPGYRNYPYGASLAHIVGYRHPLRGLTGVEGAADALISGYIIETKEDIENVGKNALREHRKVGSDIVITVDAELQKFAYEQLAGRRGAVVGIDPRDGSVRVIATSPSFDPNHFENRLNTDPASPLLNRALHGRYPPGSTFKLAISALAVENGVADVLPCPAGGYYAPGARRPIRDHEYYDFESKGLAWPGFGSLSLASALAKSSNTYFAQAGVTSGTDAFNRLADSLWINARIPIYEGPSGSVSSQKGHVPKLGRGERRELAQLSIVQGRLLVTPLHLAMLTSAVADKGRLFLPKLIETDFPRELPRPMTAATSAKVRKAMRKAVQTGTAKGADIPGLSVCGKTGTAQNPGGDSHAWFVCFAPMENPQLALAVLVENAGYGSQNAVPVAAEVLKKAVELNYITVNQ